MTVAGPVQAGDDAALCATLDALALPTTIRQRRQLSKYVDVLLQWNAVHNLTAVRERADILVQHLADCLAIVAPLQSALATMPLGGRRARVLDVGSGGGLPGLVIATLLPDTDVTCLDSVGKKMAFVRQAALEMQLTNVVAAHARIESFQGAAFDVITARAFATLDRFVASSTHLLRASGTWLAMKGRQPDDELAAMQTAGIATFHVEQLTVPGLGAERCLVWMRRD